MKIITNIVALLLFTFGNLSATDIKQEIVNKYIMSQIKIDVFESSDTNKLEYVDGNFLADINRLDANSFLNFTDTNRIIFFYKFDGDYHKVENGSIVENYKSNRKYILAIGEYYDYLRFFVLFKNDIDNPNSNNKWEANDKSWNLLAKDYFMTGYIEKLQDFNKRKAEDLAKQYFTFYYNCNPDYEYEVINSEIKQFTLFGINFTKKKIKN